MQGTEFDATGDGLVGRGGIPQCVVGAQGDDGVDLRIDRGDAVQVSLDDIAGGDLFRRDQRRQGGRIPIVQRPRIPVGDRVVGGRCVHFRILTM
jgi:hypothetical protein